jgi:hypothetical protein
MRTSILLLGLSLIIGASAVALVFRPSSIQTINRTPEDDLCPQCDDFFNDGTNQHNQAYKKEGIAPQQTLADLESLRKKKVLVRVQSNSRYVLAPMQHSKPLLLPKASGFLKKLSDRYRAECKKSSISYYPFTITSMTRSVESVNQLSETNSNAIEHSAHLRGKTIDISYNSFVGRAAQKKAFIEALRQLRAEKTCYVKYEFNQKCLHITVR